ncbi:MAG TPA: peptidoglycan-associated lipoprotein Pal [Candidatus Binataceae bacterium]|nr:peptidoglycan-associated lipoprotein Pal [Candidatus Binataceae bacterium]
MAKAADWRIAVVATLAIVALAGAGCSSKKPEGAGGPGEGQNGLGQSSVSSSDSLSQLQKGTLGAGNQGPLTDIHFDYNDSTVRAQDGEILKTNADWLQKNPTTHAQIEGHCDDRGSEEYNLALGAKRAQAAKDYLQTLGVDASRLSTISYGKELPLCAEETDECWAQNRRDHFAVSQSAGGPQ